MSPGFISVYVHACKDRAAKQLTCKQIVSVLISEWQIMGNLRNTVISVIFASANVQ